MHRVTQVLTGLIIVSGLIGVKVATKIWSRHQYRESQRLEKIEQQQQLRQEISESIGEIHLEPLSAGAESPAGTSQINIPKIEVPTIEVPTIEVPKFKVPDFQNPEFEFTEPAEQDEQPGPKSPDLPQTDS